MHNQSISPSLNALVLMNKGIELPLSKKILPLPNGLVFIVDTTDNFVNTFDGSAGVGHEPRTVKKIMDFTRVGEAYVEVGASYGDFVFQVSTKIGDQGRAYAFEPGGSVFKNLKTSLSLNNLANVVVENLAVSDREQEVNFIETAQQDVYGTLGSYIDTAKLDINKKVIKATTLDAYFKDKTSVIDVVRLDAEGSECRVLKGAENIINSSPDIRFFIEWQRSLLNKYESLVSMENCLSNFISKGFIFLDTMQFNIECNNDYSKYKLTVSNILMASHIEFIAIREKTLHDLIIENKLNGEEKDCFPDYNQFLYSAAMKGDIALIENYLANGADINFIDEAGGTALYIAAQGGDVQTTSYLLEKRANTEIKSIHGLSPLYVASVNKHYEIMKLLLKAGASTESSLPSGYTPLYYAVIIGDMIAVTLLLNAGANKNVVVEGIDIIQTAKDKGRVEIIKLLTNIEVKPDNAALNNLLYYAAQVGDAQKAAELIAQGAKINKVQEVSGMAPLYVAIQYGHVNVAALLIKHGANIETKHLSGSTPLYFAVNGGDVASVKLLLGAGANKEVIVEGFPLFYLAVYNGYTEIVGLLLEHNTNISFSVKGFNALYIAAKRGFAEIVDLLIKAKMNIQEAQSNGKTALDIAAENGHTKVIKLLLNNGANIGFSQKAVFKLLLDEVKHKAILPDKENHNIKQNNIVDELLKSSNDSSDALNTITKFGITLMKVASCLQENIENANFIEVCGLVNISSDMSEL